MFAPVSLCDELSVQILEPLPVSVQVGSVSASHSPHVCAVGFMGIVSVSVCVASRAHTLVFEPVAVQVRLLLQSNRPIGGCVKGLG